MFGTLTLATLAFTWAVLEHRREEMEAMAARQVSEIAELVVASTRYAMMLNQHELAERIVVGFGHQQDIERVRVISKSGEVVHSNVTSEVGRLIDRRGEPCVVCHSGRTSALTDVPRELSWRVVSGPGGRSLTAMRPIRNEPNCSSASCHEHKSGQRVLGVVDVSYSLREIDQAARLDGYYIMGASVVFIALFALLTGLFLQRMVYRPLFELEAGARRVQEGNFKEMVPSSHDDEFGRVAQAFNGMSSAVQHSRQQLEQLVATLELRVQERTHELLSARAEVAQSEKLASIGMLASGVAHEINNPLTGVLTFTSLLREKTPDDSPDAEDLDLVIRETKRCASIIRRLLDFAREKVPTQQYFDLNAIVQDTLKLVQGPVQLHQIDLRPELDPLLPQIWGDPDLIKQVVLNLVVNAQQAIRNEGCITVRTQLHPNGISGVRAGPCVGLTVQDNGCGIPAQNQARIFEPFFTSKEVGQGTGLGLSVSYGIVKAHGGRITVESVVDEGSTFHVWLPVGPDTDPDEPEGSAAA